MQLPEEFIRYTREVMGDQRFQQYLESFNEEAPVSIRLNPLKATSLTVSDADARVPWCPSGYYLKQRPQFTMDPLLHAGCYYVQEAASMFLDEVLRQHFNPQCSSSPVPSSVALPPSVPSSMAPPQSVPSTAPPCTRRQPRVLDLCAAPGGKSTLLRSALPADCILYSNEPVRSRASILLENVTKWGYPNHIVTSNYPHDYRASELRFDLILCDVPCSGEGMFRRDEATIREWSPQNVERCWQLQRQIVSDAWACLNPGGLLVYSTCTFNTKENEENVRWFIREFDAEVLSVETRPEWNITGSLLEGFTAPVYRFIPGITRSEGLFMCVLRKQALPSPDCARPEVDCSQGDARRTHARQESLHNGKGGNTQRAKEQRLHSIPPPPSQGEATGGTVPLDYPQAIAYLRGEALVLPSETPRGIVTVTFMGHPLGQMKNIGTRANNLYPKEWRIKTTHTLQEYAPILLFP